MGLLVEVMAVPLRLRATVSEAVLHQRLVLILALPLLITLFSPVIHRLLARNQDFPIVGKQSGLLLPMWRARVRYVFKGAEMIKEGYQKVVQTIFDRLHP